MQCSGIDATFWHFCIARVLMLCLGVSGLFRYLCNILVLVQCSGVDLLFTCMLCLGVDAMLEGYNVQVSMYCSSVC